MDILYPIHIDRWTNPIATLLRQISSNINNLSFYSFSNPETDEDVQLGENFWEQENIHKTSLFDLLFSKFDVIHHASATWKNLGASCITRLRSLDKASHVFTVNVQPHKGDKYYQQYNLGIKMADVLVAVSKAVARDIEEKYNRDVTKVIPNGVDLEFFNPQRTNHETLNSYDISEGYFLFVSRLMERKNPDFFIEMAEHFPDYQFIMVGPYRTEEEKSRYLNLASEKDNVEYLGLIERSEVRDLMYHAEALLFPSEKEGLPLTCCEAAAMGLPIIAQPKSSLPEVVKAGRTGWLFDIEEVEKWVNCMEKIINWSPQKRNRFRTQSREFIAENYSWDVISRQYRDLYDSLGK